MDTTSDQIADRLTTAFSTADHARARPWLWSTLLRLLSQGRPVTTGQLSAATDASREEVREALATLPDTEYDDAGRIVGSGLTLNPTPHRFEVDGRHLYTWCALDTLMFPAVLGRTAHVASPCHATGTLVQLTVEPDRITRVEPATAVVSLLVPDDVTFVRSSFCDQVHFFASIEATRPWLAEHPEATAVPVEQALALGLRFTTTLKDPDQDGCCC